MKDQHVIRTLKSLSRHNPCLIRSYNLSNGSVLLPFEPLCASVGWLVLEITLLDCSFDCFPTIVKCITGIRCSPSNAAYLIPNK